MTAFYQAQAGQKQFKKSDQIFCQISLRMLSQDNKAPDIAKIRIHIAWFGTSALLLNLLGKNKIRKVKMTKICPIIGFLKNTWKQFKNI